jgi:bifunctional DNA-binding transcriptional regulator/antitoxin component of YhaV-PrlF toxin-antitoxin module
MAPPITPPSRTRLGKCTATPRCPAYRHSPDPMDAVVTELPAGQRDHSPRPPATRNQILYHDGASMTAPHIEVPERASNDARTRRRRERTGPASEAITARLGTSEQIIGALALPCHRAASPELTRPLPMPQLHRLPRDGSMLYGIGRIDPSGRVADQDVVAAMGWQPGDRIEVSVGPQAIVMRASPHGLVCVPRRPCVLIPATVRHARGISAGDHVLLAAAPDHGVLIVHTLSELDTMLSDYHSSASIAS